MLSFYSVKLNRFEMQVFNSVSNKLSRNEFKDYLPHSYTNLNLSELATIAKYDQSAKEELFKRIMPKVTAVIKRYNRNYKLEDEGVLYKYISEGLDSIINSYTQSKGLFINFLTKSINRVFFFRVIKILKEKRRKKERLGNKIKDEERLLDIEGDCPNFKAIALKADLIDYISKMKKIDRKMFLLYLKGFTITEIASCLNFSPANVSVKIRKLLNKWNLKFSGFKI